ncbi:MAG TPA: hypothetical protein VGM81_13030 [Burkholderiaceae bacterium]|jgi:hypothetical protein
MKLIPIVLIALSAGLLCSCASAPQFQSSINGLHYQSPPTSLSDPRMRHSQFYRDDDDSPAWMRTTTPQSNK